MESFEAFSDNSEDAKSSGPVPTNSGVEPNNTSADAAEPRATTTSAPPVSAASPADEGSGATTAVSTQPTSPVYPQLSNTALEPPLSFGGDEKMDDEEEELDLSKSFIRTASPSPADLHRNKDALVGKPGDEGVIKMHKFTLHETVNYYYIVGTDLLDLHFRVLKIDRTCDPGELNIIEDDVVYTKQEVHQLLNAIDQGNKSSGGLKMKASFWGLLGFIRFTGHCYMIYVTKRSQVALIGGPRNPIYHTDKDQVLELEAERSGQSPDLVSNALPPESRWIEIRSD